MKQSRVGGGGLGTNPKFMIWSETNPFGLKKSGTAETNPVFPARKKIPGGKFLKNEQKWKVIGISKEDEHLDFLIETGPGD